MNANQRNNAVKQYVSEKLDDAAASTESDFESLEDYASLDKLLDQLIDVKAMGFRGVVATAIAGMHVSSHYDPLNDFYSCNPRSIFEQGIFYAFENRIPCGKSDPLNVAKNINVLDEEWAKGKRPQSAAQAAVDFLRILVDSDNETKESLVNFFFYKLHKYAEKVGSINIDVPDASGESNRSISKKLSIFTIDIPESGTIPQFVIATLLKAHYARSTVTVQGGDESVFGTNTTSKKPADIWLEDDGKPTLLIEVTVKKIDHKRLDDCLQSLSTLNLLDLPLRFICRIPADISTIDNVVDDWVNFKGKIVDFIDIEEFISTVCSLLTDDELNNVINEITDFVARVDRPVTTKDGLSLRP